MDAYYAPYKKHTHYWIGLLLLVRCVLFLVFALNSFSNANINLLVVTSVTAGLGAVAWLQNKLYEKQINDFLEAASLINLCILSASTYHVKMTGGNQAKVAYASVGIAFVTFICVVIHKLYLLVCKRFDLPELCGLKKYVIKIIHGNRETDANEETEMDIKEQSFKPSTTVVELREPLLDR